MTDLLPFIWTVTLTGPTAQYHYSKYRENKVTENNNRSVEGLEVMAEELFIQILMQNDTRSKNTCAI